MQRDRRAAQKSLRRFGSFLPSLPPLSVSLWLPLGVVWLRAQARGSFAELVALTGQSQHLPALVRAGVASQGVPASALSIRGGPGPGRFATRTFHYSVAAALGGRLRVQLVHAPGDRGRRGAGGRHHCGPLRGVLGPAPAQGTSDDAAPGKDLSVNGILAAFWGQASQAPRAARV